jgi:hypothetical protein
METRDRLFERFDRENTSTQEVMKALADLDPSALAASEEEAWKYGRRFQDWADALLDGMIEDGD